MMASGENLVNEERSMNKEPSSPCACSGGNGQQTACASEQASTETTVFHVSNMDCRNEEALVRRTLEGMPGVERLSIDGKTPSQQLAEIGILGMGFDEDSGPTEASEAA